MGLTNERADELVAAADDFVKMLAACKEAFGDLYQPLRDTQKNDVPVRAAVLALAARRAALGRSETSVWVCNVCGLRVDMAVPGTKPGFEPLGDN
jgi:hypothetical protein